ncbi:hypothetical protein SADUNF_Sadunf11G0094400 [Salix dunnii]|uniref:Uncharacterized protein n=1 Tax=Salix dunnii TaxID=1413687 RepID=A0A835MQN6_9ROSI|nr:hypothetical protein SADUNF_Sadunf11G0094400 [Salix dunnii]
MALQVANMAEAMIEALGEQLTRKEETVKTTLSMPRELVYVAEDILTDCLHRAEYRNEGFSAAATSPHVN